MTLLCYNSKTILLFCIFLELLISKLQCINYERREVKSVADKVPCKNATDCEFCLIMDYVFVPNDFNCTVEGYCYQNYCYCACNSTFPINTVPYSSTPLTTTPSLIPMKCWGSDCPPGYFCHGIGYPGVCLEL